LLKIIKASIHFKKKKAYERVFFTKSSAGRGEF